MRLLKSIAAKDYSLEKISVWAPDSYDENAQINRMLGINPFIVFLNGTIAGYADLQSDSYIDHFYCSKEYIGKGACG